ncbi:MAG: isochorismatase family protein [Cytophagaceae bacterium]
MEKALLITQCLQNDFVQPLNKFDPLPNALHVGYRESLRLVGEKINEGPVNTLMEWAYLTSEKDLKIIHIRDWHDAADPKQQDHLRQFGMHCIQNTRGADFIFSSHIKPGRDATVIDSLGLNDFMDTGLEELLKPYKNIPLKVGIVGVWTEAKVTYLAYELRTRYPLFDIAICSALAAGSSTAMHFIALDQMKNVLGLQVYESIGDFTNFLNGTMPKLEQRMHSMVDSHHFSFDHDTLRDTDKKLLNYLYRDAKEAEFKVLDGGFSGNVVLKAKARDTFGHWQVPTVVKMGKRDLISKERTAFERIQEILGNSAPSIVDFAEDSERGAIKYRYAAMLDEKVTSFQKFYATTEDQKKIDNVLDVVFDKQLGRLYKAARLEKINLLHYYEFFAKYAGSVRGKVELITGKKADGDTVIVEGTPVFNVCNFYEKDLGTLDEYLSNSHYISYVHGDLNGANVIIDAQENIWIIDFFHTHPGHVLKDLIKMENDLLFIFTKINSAEELKEAMKLIDILHGVTDLVSALDPADQAKFKFPQFSKALKTIKKLRAFYPALINLDKDPYQYYVAMMRYNMHTLSFDECNDWQKKLALYSGGKCCEKVRNYLLNFKKLRIDYLHSEEMKIKGNGLIGLTILPGRKDRNRNVEDDLNTIKNENIRHILCLLSEDEFAEYGIPDLKKQYEQKGFQVKYVSIKDQAVPTKEAMKESLEWMDKVIDKKEKVLVHCVGGLGRTGTVAACYLKKYSGLSGTDAIEVVRESRSPRAVENAKQEEFVNEF